MNDKVLPSNTFENNIISTTKTYFRLSQKTIGLIYKYNGFRFNIGYLIMIVKNKNFTT